MLLPRCLSSGNPCGKARGASCVNTEGSFYCECTPGYRTITSAGGSFYSCEDVDECAGRECVAELYGGKCLNSPGSYTCSCTSGFNGSGYSADNGCWDLDECARGSHSCGQSQTCQNSPGSYECVCSPDDWEESLGECYPPGFWKHNKPLLQKLHFSGEPSSLQGMLRTWDLPGSAFDGQSHAVGMAQWCVCFCRFLYLSYTCTEHTCV